MLTLTPNPNPNPNLEVNLWLLCHGCNKTSKVGFESRIQMTLKTDIKNRKTTFDVLLHPWHKSHKLTLRLRLGLGFKGSRV